MLILLDIDGVLVPANSWRKPEILDDGFPAFSSMAANALKYILDVTKANILLTTSHKSNYSVAQWRAIFANRGISLHQLDTLPENTGHLTRKHEVTAWYSNEKNKNQHFVIIDDDKSLNALADPLKERLVLTSGFVGLTFELADKAVKLLQTEHLPVLV